MSRELRTTLAIMVVALVVFSPAIFAAPSAATTNYLALVMHIVPSVPPTFAIATNTPTKTPIIGVTLTPTFGSPPTRTPFPTATPTLSPPTYNNCQADPNPNAAPNYPVRITNINKVAETVTLENIGVETIDLTGWHMCSITGNQQHPISGSLAAGTAQTYANSGGPIWNNSSADPGALYNAAGQLVSYFNS
jgi:hypothetical protein